MSGVKHSWPAALALFASAIGLAFASLSSIDYTKHLDRQVHDIHCSYVPGLGAEASPDNACRVAMYSPYAALFRDRYWGGVPIALFAVGAFSFFAAFALYLVLSGRSAPRRGAIFLGVFGVTPLLVSILMGTISALKLGHFCKTCVGIYIASALLAVGGVVSLLQALRDRSSRDSRDPSPADATTVDAEPYGRNPDRTALPTRPDGHFSLVLLWCFALGVFTMTPALLYVSALPSYASYITGCGKLEKAPDANSGVLHVALPSATQPATLFVDPLCPTCKAFHQRLAAEGVLDQLDLTLVLFPLDNTCNWMLDSAVHPGSCMVSKAILCSDRKAMQVLEWSYENQEEIKTAAKAGAGLVNVRAMIRDRFPGLDTCIDSKDTTQRLNRMLRYIVSNHLPISTPQIFLGETRLCDEDTDMGLSYTIRKLAPALRSP